MLNEKLIGTFALTILLSGCGTPSYENDLRRHTIAIDKKGRAVDPTERDRIKDFSAYVEAILRHVDAQTDSARERFRNAGQTGVEEVRRILVYVHGGLVETRPTLVRLDEIIGKMKHEKSATDWYYPVFITWPSGGPSTYAEHLLTFRQGESNAILGYPTSPFVLTTDLTQGIARTPLSLSYQITNDIAVGGQVALAAPILPSWSNAFALKDAAGDADYRVALGEYHRGTLVQVGRFFGYLLTFPSKLLTQITVLDGMGPGAWNVMRHRIVNLFRRQKEFDVTPIRGEREELVQHLEAGPTGALALFLEQLKEHIEKRRGEIRYEIALVGHSMGAIVLNEALRLFPEAEVARIVYLAPACSIRDAARVLVPFLEKHEQSQFHVLTLHPVAEGDEINFCDVIPRGSLLEWIDNWYTRPDSITERRLGKFVNLMRALHLFRDVRSRVSVKAFGVEPNSIPQRHGDFSECPFWREEFWDETGPLTYFRRGDDWEAGGTNDE